MDFKLVATPPHEVDAACVVTGVFKNEPLEHASAALDEASGGRLRDLLEAGDIRCEAGKTTLLHGLDGVAAPRVLVVGLGKRDKFDRIAFDKACMAAGKFLREHPLTDAHLCLHQHEVDGLDAAWRLRHAALAVDRSNYLYTTTKPLKDDSPVPLKSLSLAGDDALDGALAEARALGAAYRRARHLGDLPPNICTPAYLAQQARDIAGQYEKASVEVLERAEMVELGMDALLGVAAGSETDPKLIVMQHRNAGDAKPYVLVGKGITFDTGGISLKPREHMDQMKYDMCGAASVIGAFVACAELDLPINLVCIVAAVENMPDGKAYRPGDVLTSMSGQTIEVLNTDAEGRLILCDALTYAERFEPAALVDVATLTGACVIALGHHASGLMTPHDDLADELLAAGEQAVDRAWRLPLWEDYQSQLDSPFADMKNVGGMPAGSITAGCFLARFTRNQRWAHLDVAGSAWKWGSTEGATGRPTGLLAQFLIDRA